MFLKEIFILVKNKKGGFEYVMEEIEFYIKKIR